jgi:hypothetical protein
MSAASVTTHAFAAGEALIRQPDAIDRRRDAAIGLIVRRLARTTGTPAAAASRAPRLRSTREACDGARRR